MISNQRHAQERIAAKKAVGAFWARAERQREEQVEAATAIIQDVARYGGEDAAVVAWARLTVRRRKVGKAEVL